MINSLPEKSCWNCIHKEHGYGIVKCDLYPDYWIAVKYDCEKWDGGKYQ
jgi:hypothetical protein